MIPSERAQQVAELVKSALECSREERAAFLNEACAGNAEIRAEVDSFLQFQDEASQFIEQGALHVAAETLARDPASPVPQLIDGYQILFRIGVGGMGEVYLAEETKLRRKVALKLVRAGMDTAEIVARFRHEEQILAGLNHPNIAQLYGAGVAAGDIPFFAMEYVDGVRIDEYCNARALSTTARLQLFRKVCAAVHYAHQRLVIHRDLKPSNILVTAEGEPKLLDFGIAKLVEGQDRFTQIQTLAGAMTPDYASPEQVRGEAMTTATDVYSLGVLLYEILTGQRPYRLKTRSADEIARAISDQQPELPSTTVARSSSSSFVLRHSSFPKGDLDNIVLMALRKEPQRRYTSVGQFSEDIRRYLEGLPVIAHKDTLSYRGAKFVQRNRVAVSAASLVFLAVVSALLISLWQGENARRQRDLAQRERSKAERINQFLQRMLSFSNQSSTSIAPATQKRDVTVNEMLDQIAPQIEAELAEQPEVRAQVSRTIGSAYASQGRYEPAEKFFCAALDAQRRLYGEENAETAATMTELGILSFRQSRLDEANHLLERAVAFYRKQKEKNSPEYSPAKLALALDYFAVVSFYRGDANSPVPLLEEALRISSGANLKGNERRILTFNKSDLGAAYVSTGDLETGEAFLQEAAAEYRQILPQPPWELGSTLRLLGVAALQRNKPDEAEKYLLESEQLLRQTLGDKNGYLAMTLDRQAVALILKGDLPAAEEKARAALAMSQAVSPDNKLPWATPMWTLGNILTSDGRDREGEDCYRQALAIHEQQGTRNYLFITQSKIRLSQFLLEKSRKREAEKIALEARDEARHYLGDLSPLTKAATENLSRISEKQAKDDLAQGPE